MALKGIVIVTTADGRKLLSSVREATKQLGRSKGGSRVQALGTGYQWTPDDARKAAQKRWKRHPMTDRGYRRGQRFTRRPNVPRAPLREQYALTPVDGIQYSPALRVWCITDESGTRPISERAALRRLGHLPRENDSLVPKTIDRQVK